MMYDTQAESLTDSYCTPKFLPRLYLNRITYERMASIA